MTTSSILALGQIATLFSLECKRVCITCDGSGRNRQAFEHNTASYCGEDRSPAMWQVPRPNPCTSLVAEYKSDGTSFDHLNQSSEMPTTLRNTGLSATTCVAASRVELERAYHLLMEQMAVNKRIYALRTHRHVPSTHGLGSKHGELWQDPHRVQVTQSRQRRSQNYKGRLNTLYTLSQAVKSRSVSLSCDVTMTLVE